MWNVYFLEHFVRDKGRELRAATARPVAPRSGARCRRRGHRDLDTNPCPAPLLAVDNQ